jgi:hypothetical protein
MEKRPTSEDSVLPRAQRLEVRVKISGSERNFWKAMNMMKHDEESALPPAAAIDRARSFALELDWRCSHARGVRPSFCLLAAAAILLLCQACRSEGRSVDRDVQAATVLFLYGRGQIVSADAGELWYACTARDMKSIGAANAVVLGRWDSRSHRFGWRNTGAVAGTGVNFDVSAERNSVCLCTVQSLVESAGVRYSRKLVFVNRDTLTIESEIPVPPGPVSVQFLGPDAVLLCCRRDAAELDGPERAAIWQLEPRGSWPPTAVKEVGEIRFPSREIRIARSALLTNQRLLLHLWFPDASTSTDSQQRSDGNPRREEKGTSEIAVYDLSANRFLEHEATSISAAPYAAVGTSMAVSNNGAYVALLGHNHIEVRSVPSLAMMRMLSLAKEGDYWNIAISDDGQHVAFGIDRLEIWDTRTGIVELLDKMNSELLSSKRFRCRECYANRDDVGGRYFAAMQLCIANLRFLAEADRLAVLTHDGHFAIWDVVKKSRVEATRIADVDYLGEPHPGGR